MFRGCKDKSETVTLPVPEKHRIFLVLHPLSQEEAIWGLSLGYTWGPPVPLPTTKPTRPTSPTTPSLHLPCSSPEGLEIPMLPFQNTKHRGIQALHEDQPSRLFLFCPHSQALPSVNLFLLLLPAEKPVSTSYPSTSISTSPLPGSLP